jgi:TolA-binding protein
LNDPGKRELARHVRVDTSDARVDRLWDAVSPRLGRTRPVRRWLTAGVALAAVAVAVVLVVRRPSDGSASAWEGATLESGADATSVTLVDGSKLTVEPGSRVDMGDRSASAVKLRLRRGRVACDVTHRPERSFLVTADGVEVRVVGTRFSVSTEHGADGARVEVRVERGVVEVRGAGASGEVTRVEAGHSWSQVTKLGALGAFDDSPPVPPASATAPPLEEPAAIEPPAGREPAPAREPARPHEAASPSRSSPATSPAKGGRADGRELFEAARERWRAGDIRAAADAYQRLLDERPRDPRAGLAAFELGRLRMDRLGDMPGAARALERAVALAPGSGFREDALARLVAATAAAHDPAACARARDQYLAEFPAGVHRRTVEIACGAR